jgi:hypothetical protein
VGASPQPGVDGGWEAVLVGRSIGEASGAEVTSSGGGGGSRRHWKMKASEGGRTDYRHGVTRSPYRVTGHAIGGPHSNRYDFH